MKCILAIDQSTSGTKALLVDDEGKIIAKDSLNHPQTYPQPGWVEQDANLIWQNVLELIRGLPEKAGVPWSSIVGLALTNQRETTVAWDRQTGQPLAAAVTWQCQRGERICDSLAEHASEVLAKTGLNLSAYYPAAKAAWLLRNSTEVIDSSESGQLCIGTVDSYLLYRLTQGAVFATDLSNASRTQLMNLDTLDWDEEILSLFQIPRAALPVIHASDAIFGQTAPGILPVCLPIAGVMGDSHAALFGQCCIEPGMAKATYGTGSSIMMNIGSQRMNPPRGIVTSLAWGWQGAIHYVLEGNVTSSGDTLKWLCEDLELFQSVQEIDAMAEQVPTSDGVYLIPAFAGLGAPYFDSSARAAILGLSRGSKKTHVAKAALESIAYQNHAVISAMGKSLTELRVDGGPTRSKILMQIQADILQCRVSCSAYQEISALGVAYMGGIKLGLYSGLGDISAIKQRGHAYEPAIQKEEADKKVRGWQQAVKCVLIQK